MKVLLLTELFPEGDTAEVTGGVEARCFYVVKHLRQRHQVEVLAGGTAGGSQWRPASVASIPFRLKRMLQLLWRGLRADADVIDSSILVVHPLAWLLGLIKRRPVVLWYPDVLIGSWRNGGFSKLAGTIGELYERLTLKLPVEHFIAISQSTRDKLVAHGVRPEKITIVHCGFEPGLAEAARRHAAAAPPRDPAIVVVCRLVPYKRVDLSIQALARLRSTHPALRLRVIGQGPERQRLEELAEQLGVRDAVDFLGYVPHHDDVLAEIAQASVLVSASEIEGFGISVVEGAAVGVPIVITDMPVFREVTHDGMGGLLFRMGDADDLAAKVDRLLTDDALRARSVADGRALVERYAWDELSAQTEAVFAEVIRARDRRSR